MPGIEDPVYQYEKLIGSGLGNKKKFNEGELGKLIKKIWPKNSNNEPITGTLLFNSKDLNKLLSDTNAIFNRNMDDEKTKRENYKEILDYFDYIEKEAPALYEKSKGKISLEGRQFRAAYKIIRNIIKYGKKNFLQGFFINQELKYIKNFLENKVNDNMKESINYEDKKISTLYKSPIIDKKKRVSYAQKPKNLKNPEKDDGVYNKNTTIFNGKLDSTARYLSRPNFKDAKFVTIFCQKNITTDNDIEEDIKTYKETTEFFKKITGTIDQSSKPEIKKKLNSKDISKNSYLKIYKIK
jgi:hypothetical protein